MTLDVIARPPSLVEKVCNQLAQIVRRDRHEDDGWLPTERELSEQLGVSRSVVREATKRLESQGLVEIQHGIGIKAVDKLHKPLNGSLALLIRRALKHESKPFEVESYHVSMRSGEKNSVCEATVKVVVVLSGAKTGGRP